MQMGISRSFKKFPADHISFSMESGYFYVLIGVKRFRQDHSAQLHQRDNRPNSQRTHGSTGSL